MDKNQILQSIGLFLLLFLLLLLMFLWSSTILDLFGDDVFGLLVELIWGVFEAVRFYVFGYGLSLVIYEGFCDFSGGVDCFDAELITLRETYDRWSLFGVNDLLSFRPCFGSHFFDWYAFLELARYKIGLEILWVLGSISLFLELLFNLGLNIFNLSV